MNPNTSTQDDAAGSKKAVHVKWAGKTIALGTFPAGEADEKCARAKALTRAWRSTMRPKPTREWVMNELERLGVRIVSGKLGRKAEDEEEGVRGTVLSNGNFPMGVATGGGGGDMELMVAQQERIAQQRRDSNGGLGSNGMVGGGSLGGIPPAVSGQQVNQHYEMLKLHHMNLLQELHETTMMMNMYQQQHLQQEQLKLQQRGEQLGGLIGPKHGGLGDTMDSLYGNQRGSLGLGMGPRGSLGLGSAFGHRGSLEFGGIESLLKSEGDGLGGRKRHMDDPGDGDMKRHRRASDEDS